MATEGTAPSETEAEAPKKQRRLLPFMIAGAVVAVAGGLGGVYALVPGAAEMTQQIFGHKEPSQAAPSGPIFAELPEMSLTLTNGGQARQLRIRISLELAPTTPPPPASEVLSPKVYDALLTYLRTLTDAEVENSLSIDRIRGDIYRRLTLMLGPNVVRDVLITGLVIA